MEIATTKKQREIMQHALGLHRRPKSYRNYYCAAVGSEEDTEITKLVEMHLMEKGQVINDGKAYYAFVTEIGRDELSV